MQTRTQLVQALRRVDAQTFEPLALAIFRYQAQNSPLYQQFLKLLNVSVRSVKRLNQIPFLPISFFKQKTIKTGEWQAQTIFSSSGTTGQVRSKHHIRDLDLYKQNALRSFAKQYGSIKDYCVLALLPSYLERSGSSLVYMADQFIQASQHPLSGFFLYNTQELVEVLGKCTENQQPTLLLGVTYALLDLAKQYPMPLGQTIVMETGGMKGKRKELPKPVIHQRLKTAFQVPSIHAEYGMTELLSQAYAKADGLFVPSASMRVLVREITDPLHILPLTRTGVLNIIDLANIDSCSFIATDDLGRCYKDGSFEVLGRLDRSDLRGCNLLLS